jgi:hypothetical protein
MKLSYKEMRELIAKRAAEYNRNHCSYCEGRKFAYLDVVEELDKMLGTDREND